MLREPSPSPRGRPRRAGVRLDEFRPSRRRDGLSRLTTQTTRGAGTPWGRTPRVTSSVSCPPVALRRILRPRNRPRRHPDGLVRVAGGGSGNDLSRIASSAVDASSRAPLRPRPRRLCPRPLPTGPRQFLPTLRLAEASFPNGPPVRVPRIRSRFGAAALLAGDVLRRSTR